MNHKLWIGLAAGLLVFLAAAAWLGGADTEVPAASPGRAAAVRPMQQDPLPRAEDDKKALLRLFLLVGLARKH